MILADLHLVACIAGIFAFVVLVVAIVGWCCKTLDPIADGIGEPEVDDRSEKQGTTDLEVQP
ncbi:MAG: hypothetical protein CMJ48_12120 [Planctomycetaceae bacterium]|nr:hypothetical protein [Planctomycetaceae bacterium]